MVSSRHMSTLWRASCSLSTLRLCLYGLSSVQIAVTAYVTLTIDMRQDENAQVFILIYAPVNFYCEWKEQNGSNNGVKHVETLKYCRDLLMTAIIFPATMYTDTMFWCLWLKDPALIADVRIFEYLPNWAQHSLHSVSLVFVLLDVLLVPRQRPTSMKLGLTIMTAFLVTYSMIISIAKVLGYPVYAFLRHMNWLDQIILVIMNYFMFLMYYTVQWLLIDCRWRNHNKKTN